MKQVPVPCMALLAAALAATAAAQAPIPLHPEVVVSHVVDGPTPDGVGSHVTVFLTNAGGVPLAADVAFQSDFGDAPVPFAVPFIARGATVPVDVRAVVGSGAPDLVTGVVRVRFLALPPDDPGAPHAAPGGVVAAEARRAFDPARFPGAAPQLVVLSATPIVPLADHPPCPPPPCRPGPAPVPELRPCPPDQPCPTPDHPCRPAPDAGCEPPPPPPPPPLPPCPPDQPCPTPDHHCVPAPDAGCGPPLPPSGGLSAPDAPELPPELHRGSRT